MPTKLTRYSEGVIEAAWLAAIIMTPLFFNKYSSRIFEPDKATLLRSLSLIILFAWCVKLIEQWLTARGSDAGNINIKSLIKIPLALPIGLLTLVYIITTIFSVAPRISFWGSYQRLQGLYTTFAYVVLFASLIGNLREKAQVERLITTAVLTSLPVSLYGILQHFGIDPIPWGSDVTRRVASHMGNPIFVAAFLIMVFPLTVGRIVDSFGKILWEAEGLGYHTGRSTIYIFIAALQLIAIYFTQSRGPWLGLFSGGFFLFVLLSLYWRKRWLTSLIVTVAILASAFLVVLNIPGGPLQDLHSMDSFRRLGQLLNTQSRTARVRALIWGGAAEMVAPHDPIEYPDGHTDRFNAIRPLIGYGPESMHMAYNPFYPPELAYVEARNASPDRSHNETWDSLVFTGFQGLVVYLFLFTSVFYYGLKWLNLISTKRQRLIFFIIYFGIGLIGAIVFSMWQGIAFAGLGLPFGLISGLIIYLGLIAVAQKGANPDQTYSGTRSLVLIVLLSAIVAHFAEINFGISIVSTKTYFFVYAGLIVAVGYQMPKMGEYLQTDAVSKHKNQTTKYSRRRKRPRFRKSAEENRRWRRSVILASGVVSLLLLPMYYEYIANLRGLTTASQVLWTSLTQLEENVISYGVLALVITTWLSAGVTLASEIPQKHLESNWWKSFGSILAISGAISLFYGTWLSGSLTRLARMVPQNINQVITQAAGLENLLTQFFTFLLLGILVLGVFLPTSWPTRTRQGSFWGSLLSIVGFLMIIWLSIATNLRIIHADITFKMAEPFSNSRQWEVANTLYRRAIALSPDEDYYYLFLGRGSLEEAKTITDPVQQEQAFRTAEADLLRAQSINPLNPDHTANLGRLYSWWALQTPDPEERYERGRISDNYYSRVMVISPNNARLWDEWAILQLNVLDDPDRAYELLSHSLELDPRYGWTHALMGDYFSRLALAAADLSEGEEDFQQAIYHYQQAIDNEPENTNYYYALASAYQSIGDIHGVITILEDSLEVAASSEIWKIEDNLVHYYLELNDIDSALQHANKALAAAPDSERERLQTVINQLQDAQ
jgi:tetratricopeptide (TPR) repeat protein/O-antigen ligase